MTVTVEGGTRLPVRTIVDADLRGNGGNYKLMGGPVLHVDGLNFADAGVEGRPLVKGAATAVYFVTAAQIGIGRFKQLQRGPRLRVYEAPVGTDIEGHIAIPVYDPGGAW